MEVVGKSVPRLDARDKVRGIASYMEDMRLTGMLHGKLLRSPHAHARILSIDTTAAEKLPGVRGVITGKDFPFLHGESFVDEPFLAQDKVRYAGEAVVGVVAVDEATAEAARDLIQVTYEPLPALFDPVEAYQEGAPLIHENIHTYAHPPVINPVKGRNICNDFHLETGDVEKAFREADFVFEDTYTTQMIQHCCLEPHIAICLVDSEGRITLWANNDSPYRARKELSDALKISMSKIRIISPPYIGGNFGGKGGLKAEACAVALAHKVRNRPVRVVYTREEEFTSSLVRHPAIIHIKTGVKKDGTLLARKVEVFWATGAYAEKGPTVARLAGVSAAGPYRIANLCLDGYVVYTNKPVAGACRGYGGPQLAWAYESQMDDIARRLSLDPVAIRLKNAYEEENVHVSGQVLESVGLKECIQKAAEHMEWGKRPLGPNQGRGIACFERGVKTPFGSAAFVKVNEDGTVEVLSSTTEVGQGAETILCQIVAEEMGIPLHQVNKVVPDTSVTPFDTSTTASRSTFHMGNAVKMAAQDAKGQLLKMAADALEAAVEDLEMKDGKIYVKGVPHRALTIPQAMRQRYGTPATVLGRGFYYPDFMGDTDYFSLQSVFWIYAAQGAEVEVDPITGQVKVLRLVAAHDAGRVIHPVNCEGQIEGSLSMGLGYALYEDMEFEVGKVTNPSFLSYKIPSALDMPTIEPLLVEKAHREGPFGAKGVGEPGLVGTAPAIANAIYDAMGVRIKDLPITPEKILVALREKEAAGK
ncbi:MAG: molybdopterin-dependent oxidoreductase [Chloroflexi bacterium]|nr:molybdopterin-dependent oxidoreductase [Chloroflexota bacterium]